MGVAEWVERSGDLRDGQTEHARFVVYRVKGGWTVGGVHTADELAKIAVWTAEQERRSQ